MHQPLCFCDRTCRALLGVGTFLVLAGAQNVAWGGEEPSWQLPVAASGPGSESGGGAPLQPDFKRLGVSGERAPLPGPPDGAKSEGKASEGKHAASGGDRTQDGPPHKGSGQSVDAGVASGGVGNGSRPSYRWDAPPPEMLDPSAAPGAGGMGSPGPSQGGVGHPPYPGEMDRPGWRQPGMNPQTGGPDRRSWPSHPGQSPGHDPQDSWEPPPYTTGGRPVAPGRGGWGPTPGYGVPPGGAPPGWDPRNDMGSPQGGPYPSGGYYQAVPPPGYGNPASPARYGSGQGDGRGPLNPDEEGAQPPSYRQGGYGGGGQGGYGGGGQGGYGGGGENSGMRGHVPPPGYGYDTHQGWRGNSGPGSGGRPRGPGRSPDDPGYGSERSAGGAQDYGNPAAQDGYQGSGRGSVPQGYPGPGYGR
ncbi:MAG: hypothetical protein HQL63_07210 [Magnetococcales bacterium]|nr:hypothetical protein [Magnetococcales bacterium]